jgi:hypothetical protein
VLLTLYTWLIDVPGMTSWNWLSSTISQMRSNSARGYAACAHVREHQHSTTHVHYFVTHGSNAGEHLDVVQHLFTQTIVALVGGLHKITSRATKRSTNHKT